jgi:copper chaperone CopZ
MKTITLELPMMFGDHHVTEVKKILLGIPGVDEVYASSSFHIVEVTFDDNKVDEDLVKSKLEETGYLGELPVEVEVPAIFSQRDEKYAFFRLTKVNEETNLVGFNQKVNIQGRPLWPCPGIGTIKSMHEEK